MVPARMSEESKIAPAIIMWPAFMLVLFFVFAAVRVNCGADGDNSPNCEGAK